MSKKHTRLLEEICFVHLHSMFPTVKSREIALQNPKMFNVEHMVEIAMANVGGYNFVDEYGYDFDDEDHSDCKTATLRAHDRTMIISKIENKIGSFRIVVYNEISDQVDYLYVTNKGRLANAEKGYLRSNLNQQRIRTTYNYGLDRYNKLERFRVKDFVTLATMTDEKMELLNPGLANMVPRHDKTKELFMMMFDE